MVAVWLARRQWQLSLGRQHRQAGRLPQHEEGRLAVDHTERERSVRLSAGTGFGRTHIIDTATRFGGGGGRRRTLHRKQALRCLHLAAGTQRSVECTAEVWRRVVIVIAIVVVFNKADLNRAFLGFVSTNNLFF